MQDEDINIKQQMTIILLIVFIGFVGNAMSYPIFAPLFLHPQHGGIIPETWFSNSRNIFLGITLAAYPFGQFIGSPILGSYSDRYGRKKILVLSIVGTSIGYLLSAISLIFHHLSLLVFSRLFTGLMEGNVAIATSMIADLKEVNKQRSFGLFYGVAAIGYVIGPLLGGFFSDTKIVSWFSFFLPFILACLLAIIIAFLTIFKIKETHFQNNSKEIKVLAQFNLIKRLRSIFQNKLLKSIMICSLIFTLSIDIFYELGPVYLTGRWQLLSGGIAIFNFNLSLFLAIGSSLLPHWLARFFSTKSVIITCISLTAIFLLAIVLIPSKIIIFILFGLIGLSIAVGTTNLMVELSDLAEHEIHGEVMGTQWGLRMLGDSIICLIGGVLIIISVSLPLIISCLISVIGLIFYQKNYLKKLNNDVT